MKTLFLLMIVACMTVGCATISLETPDGTKAQYTGFFRDYDKVRAEYNGATFEAEKAVVSEKTPKVSDLIEVVR
jgi:uncharacterized protein YceK